MEGLPGGHGTRMEGHERMTPIKRIVVWHTDTGRWSAWMADVWREDGSYERVIIDMTNQGLPPQTRAHLVIACRDATRRDCERLSKVVENLEMKPIGVRPGEQR